MSAARSIILLLSKNVFYSEFKFFEWTSYFLSELFYTAAILKNKTTLVVLIYMLGQV